MIELLWKCGECGAEAFAASKPVGWRWFSISKHWACEACSNSGSDR